LSLARRRLVVVLSDCVLLTEAGMDRLMGTSGQARLR
jgi:hypothetical protein